MYGAQVVLGPLEAVKARQKSKFAIETELRIALVGKTGVGKSATANTLCGEDYFESDLQAVSLTKICKQKKASVHGRDVLIIDTPGIFDTETDPTDVENEINRCVHIGAPGLHAVLYVMEIHRFRKEDKKAIEAFLNFFNGEMKDRVIVVFTHGDKLQNEGIKLEDYMKDIPLALKTFLKNCQNRFILFNNEFDKEESYMQINGLLTMIEALKRHNELAYYTDALFMKAEERLQVREKEIEQKFQQEYRKKQAEFEQTMKMRLGDEMREEREKELMEVKKEYEKKLEKVRDDIRKQISDKDSSCNIL